MVYKGLVFLVLTLLVCSSRGHRVKRTFGFLFPSSEPKKTYPVYKIHRYTGIHIQPINQQHHQQGPYPPHGAPDLGAEPPSVVEIPEDDGGYDDSSSSGLSALTSLIPLGTGVLSSALSSSTGSSGNSQKADDRIGLSWKKEQLKSIAGKKASLIALAATGAVNKVVNKGLKVKGLVKGAFKGPKTTIATSGVYTLVPYDYPQHHGFLSKIPIIGKFFHTEIPLEIPDVGLPHLPQLVAVHGPPDLPLINLPGHYTFPYKTGAYVKVKIPHNKYEIPGTSYGVPGNPVPVPQPPQDIDANPPLFGALPFEEEPEQPTTTEAPAIVTPESYPYPPALPDVPEYVPPPPPPELPEVPPENFNPFPYPPANSIPTSYPYPPQGFPYPASGYYQQGAASETQTVKADPEGPVYRHKEVAEEEQEAEGTQEKELPEQEPEKDNSEEAAEVNTS